MQCHVGAKSRLQQLNIEFLQRNYILYLGRNDANYSIWGVKFQIVVPLGRTEMVTAGRISKSDVFLWLNLKF